MQRNQEEFFFLSAAPHGFQDLGTLTRDGTCALGSESTKSEPLDLQGTPKSKGIRLRR